MISAFENRTSAFELPSSPDDGRKLTELYNVQHLQSAQLDRVSRVCISTIQRLYSMLCSFLFSLEMFTARRDRHDQTGLPLRAWHELVATAYGRSTICSLYPN